MNNPMLVMNNLIADEEEPEEAPLQPVAVPSADLEPLLVALADRRFLAWATEVPRSSLSAQDPRAPKLSARDVVVPAVQLPPDAPCWLRAVLEAAVLVGSWKSAPEKPATIFLRAVQRHDVQELEACWRLGGDIAVGQMVVAQWEELAPDLPKKRARRRSA